MFEEIYVIDNKESLTYKLSSIFKNDKDFGFKKINYEEIEEALKNIPDLIIINEETIEDRILNICELIRNNTDNSITPIMVINKNNEIEHKIDILKKNIEYIIPYETRNEELYYTIKNIIRLMRTNRTVSPLTGLPGNLQIQVEIKKKLLKKKPFCVLYFDLDNFKAYNDTYGFLKGDEIIKYTAKAIIKSIHKNDSADSFIGHIGGDDFIAITENKDYEKICQEIIIYFDDNIKKFFNEEDIERGYVEVANRKGIIEQFPITSISIGVVTVEPGQYTSSLEIGEIGAQVKHIAKTQIGSSYAVDRRKNK